MLKFNLNNVSSDLLSLLDLVIVERNRFNEPFLNISGFDKKLDLVTYTMEKEYCEDICKDYETIEELQESESLVLIFTWLIESAIHYVDSDELLENIKMFDNVENGLSYTIESDLMTIFEEIEEES